MPCDSISYSPKCNAWSHKSRWVRKEFHRTNEARARKGLQPLEKQIECTCRLGGV